MAMDVDVELGEGHSYDAGDEWARVRGTDDDQRELPDDLDRWRVAIAEWERCFQAWSDQAPGSNAAPYLERELRRCILRADQMEDALRERLALLQGDQVASVDSVQPRPRDLTTDDMAAAASPVDSAPIDSRLLHHTGRDVAPGDDLPDPWSGDPVSMDLS